MAQAGLSARPITRPGGSRDVARVPWYLSETTTMADRSTAKPGREVGARQTAACSSCVLGRATWAGACPFREVRHEEQSVLLEQGERAETVWFIKEGLVALSSADAAGTEVGCAVRGAGSLIGLEVLLDRPSPFTALALTDITTCATPSTTLADRLGQIESPLGTLLKLGIEEATRRTAEQLTLAGTCTSRVARFLLLRCVDGAGTQPLDVSQRVMARALSITPETLSRTLARLRKMGAIAGTRPVVVADVTALRAAAAGDPV